MIHQHLGRNLKIARAARGLRQLDLARRAGLRQQQVANFELGLRPTLAQLSKLAGALGVRTEDLLRPINRRLVREARDAADELAGRP